MAKRNSAQSAGSDGTTPRPRQRSFVWLQGLLCGALATLATPTALLLAVLLGPATIALFLDGEPCKPTGRTVALFSMAASVGPLKTLWTTGHSMAVAADLATRLDVVGTVWTATAAGWLLAQILPIVVRAVLEALSIARSVRLRAERARLLSDWGLDTSDGS
jgi:hypothetical protein